MGALSYRYLVNAWTLHQIQNVNSQQRLMLKQVTIHLWRHGRSHYWLDVVYSLFYSSLSLSISRKDNIVDGGLTSKLVMDNVGNWRWKTAPLEEIMEPSSLRNDQGTGIGRQQKCIDCVCEVMFVMLKNEADGDIWFSCLTLQNKNGES